MVTKYNIGEDVFVKGTVKSINVNNNGDIIYTIMLSDKRSAVTFNEHNIYGFGLCSEVNEMEG